MINEKNIEKTKFLIKKENKPVIVLGQNDDYNRKICEYGKLDIILGIDSLNRRRTLRNIDSGLNHTLAKILEKNNISIGIDLNQINSLNKRQKAEILIQIMQNIKVARKNSVKITLINYKDKLNALCLMKSLGSSTSSASKSLDF